MEPRSNSASPSSPPAAPQAQDAVEQLLERLRLGDEDALARLFEILYAELHRQACERAAGARLGGATPTLTPTALIGEAFLRIQHAGGVWRDRRHFLLSASRAMRHVLVDHFRSKRANKRDGRRVAIDLESFAEPFAERAVDLEALDEALEGLAERDPRMAKAVELRFFGGLTLEETAETLGMPLRTLERHWSAVRAWLHGRLA